MEKNNIGNSIVRWIVWLGTLLVFIAENWETIKPPVKSEPKPAGNSELEADRREGKN